MVPLAGGKTDAEILPLARLVAEPFGAELAAVHAPADIADLMPWMGEGFMGGVQISAMESLKEAAVEGERAARAACEAAGYAKTQFTSLASPVWAGLAMESRLSDVVVFDQHAACGRGPLSEAFQQIVADEQRPVIVARPGLNLHGIMALAWDGGKEATRAVRVQQGPRGPAENIFLKPRMAKGARYEHGRAGLGGRLQDEVADVVRALHLLDVGFDPARGEEVLQPPQVEPARGRRRRAKHDHPRSLLQHR
jgi:hypothetical protein